MYSTNLLKTLDEKIAERQLLRTIKAKFNQSATGADPAARQTVKDDLKQYLLTHKKDPDFRAEVEQIVG